MVSPDSPKPEASQNVTLDGLSQREGQFEALCLLQDGLDRLRRDAEKKRILWTATGQYPPDSE